MTNAASRMRARDTISIPPLPDSTVFVPPKISLKIRIANLVCVVVPFLGFAAAIALLWPVGLVGWTEIGLFLGMYLITGMGITIGYHRLFTHKSFDTGPVMTAIIGVAGSMAVEGPILDWVATHRKHHQHSDHEDDPHSPHLHDGGLLNTIKGAWHSHVGWILKGGVADHERYCPDLLKKPQIVWLSNRFVLWVALGLAIPTVLGGLITMSWMGALLGFVWGGLARIFFVHHITWSVNSVCHIWGRQPYDCHDESRNNVVCGVLALGEGWHNNHHAFPTSARHGLKWWQFDSSYILIKAMSYLGLVRNIKVPTPERLESKKRAA